MQYIHAQGLKHFSAAKIGKGIEIPMLYCGRVDVTSYLNQCSLIYCKASFT